MRRMSEQSAPAKQEALFEGAEPKASNKKSKEIKNFFKENMAFTTQKERMNMLNKFFEGSAIKNYDDLTRSEAERFLKRANSNPDDFKDELLSSIGYNALFPPKTVSLKGKEWAPDESGYRAGKAEQAYNFLLSEMEGVDVDKDDDIYSEWKEALDFGTRMALRDNEHGRGLDVIAEKFDFENESQLLDALKFADRKKEQEEQKKGESFDEKMQKKELEHYRRKEQEEDRDEANYRVDVSGEPNLDNASSKVQEIYSDLLEKLTGGETREELMKEAWRIWYDWSGYNREDLEENGEEVVPFKIPATNGNQFWAKTFYKQYPREIEGVSEETAENLADMFGRAMERASELFDSEQGPDEWENAVTEALQEENMYEPMGWVAARAHELAETTSYEDAFEMAYRDWILQDQ